MDSASGSYMQYNNHNNDDISQFLNDVNDYANYDNNTSNQFDPALFADSSSTTFPQQSNHQSQPPQSTYAQVPRQSQSQSPALPQFKPNQGALSPAQYSQNVYNQQSMGSAFDPQVLSRPSHSPGPFDQFAYQTQQLAYGQSPFDYRFNSFQQRQSATQTQAFRPQVGQQAQHYLTNSRPSSQVQPHMSQVQVCQNSAPFHWC